ncbi:MAG: cell division protein FtsZ [Hyphomicrobiales bacterium]|nr:cell division protein FtsZ [Hyphomicrobiales bacterium]
MTINLKVPNVKELKPRITVFGVGGAGGNAVNNMIQSGLQGVDFVVANTDAQALAASCAERRIQMGTELTEGLGAGSHPEIGNAAAEEAIDEIRDQLSGAHMVFVTAGMGGGTGTGAAPVIARAAREQGILTVGVVTKPFQFEGVRRMRTADAGIVEMQGHVDTLIIIPNQNLFRVANEKTTFADAFAMADQVLYSGVACITDLIVKEGLINLDFADVRAVMSEMGKAMMGTGEASGEKRAVEAAEAAISNPLLDDVSMRGARGLLISITGGHDLTLYEVDEAATRIREEVDPDANIIVGATFDDSLEGVIRVSVVSTGIDGADLVARQSGEAMIADMSARTQAAAEARLHLVRSQLAQSDKLAQEEQDAGDGDAEGSDGAGETLTEDGVRLRPLKPKAAPVSAPDAQAEVEEDGDAPFIPPAAERPERDRPRMPRIDEFPLPAQNEARAAGGQESQMGIEAHKKKSNFFKRLASAGLGMLEGEEVDDGRAIEPSLGKAPVREGHTRRSLTREQTNRQGPRREAAVHTEKTAGAPAPTPGDDDHLEIPAFLRRQAN